MLERPLVRPPYDVVIMPHDQLQKKDGLESEGLASHVIKFNDEQTGSKKVAVISSPDQRLIDDIASIVQFRYPVAVGTVLKTISIYSIRNPRVRLTYRRGDGIVCEEPSCAFNLDGGCTNLDVVIDDDCMDDPSCLTYIQSEGFYD